MWLAYFFIAAFNLGAILFGLYLNQQVMALHHLGDLAEAEHDAQLNASLSIANLAIEAQTEYVGLFDAASLDNAGVMFASRVDEFAEQTELLRRRFAGNADKLSAQKANSILQGMDAKMAEVRKSAADVSGAIKNGNTAFAQSGISKMQGIYSALRIDTTELNRLIGRIKSNAVRELELQASRLQRLEYFVSITIILVTCCFVGFGFLTGRWLKRKFAEFAKINAELAESNEQALAFSKEIQFINSDMDALNKQLNENIVKLREAQDEALRKGKMAQLGNLTATVAHELRNPLSTVRTSAYLLARKIKDKGLGIEPQLQRIDSGVIRCDNIITQLLDFSRSKPVKPEPIVLDVWLEKLISVEAQRLPESVSIECYFGLGSRIVELEPGRFERAIINLLSNASEAMVGKGDDPRTRVTANPVITIKTLLTARGAEIIVADNGPGISSENMLKVREPLFTTKNFGTGLGISAVEQILEQHSGGFDISSTEGHGATFALWLPLKSNVEEEAA